MCEIKTLAINCGEPNPPGLRTKMRFIPAKELTGFPKTKDKMTPAGTAVGDTVTLGEVFTYVTTPGKGYWRELDVLVDTGGLNSKTIGEIGGKSFQNTIKGFLPLAESSRAAILEWNQCMANACLVCAVQDRTDRWLIVGRDNDPAHIEEIDTNFGEKQGDRAGSAFSIKSMDGSVPLLYPDTLAFDLTPNP